MVVVRTAAGNRLTCTPNHPILTMLGWVPAGGLNVGGYVVSTRGDKRMGAGNDQNEHMPAVIEEVAHAFGQARGVLSAPVPVAAEDFHGDGAGSEVAVVWADGPLGDRVDAAGAEHGGEHRFQGRDVGGVELNRSGVATLAVERHGASPRGIMGGSDLPGADIGRHLAPLHTLGGALATEFDSSIGESGSDSSAAYAIPSAEAVHRVAGEVFADQIIEVRRLPFAGHVFNLETESGFYVAESIVTHNCRCALAPVMLEAS